MAATRYAIVIGAVTLGAGPAMAAHPLYSPWPCGDTEQITQGHATDSSHRDGSKDEFAWDVGLGEGDAVVATADGVVRAVSDDSDEYCGLDGDCWTETNHVVLAFDDGTEAQYMHLAKDSTDLRVGQRVRRGQAVGQIGLSGKISAAHLHFHIQDRDDCSSQPWYCQSIPARFVDVGDPGYPDLVTSRNCVLPASCEVGEGPTEIDDGTDCFIDGVGTAVWAAEGEAQFIANAQSTASGSGHWRFRVADTARYRVEVYIPEGSTAGSVVYEVGSGSRVTASMPMSQAANAGRWITLGEGLELRAEVEAYVNLSNATGELAETTRVGVDRIRVTRTGDFVPERLACGVTGTGVEIEETGECFTRSGDNWFEDEGGRDGFAYSNSNDLVASLEIGTWEIHPGSTEAYEIWVHVPEAAETHNARYALSNGYVRLELDPVDQSGGEGWKKLTRREGSEAEAEGRFDLYAGLPAALSLGDATGEPFHGAGDERNTIVAFDSIAIAPASLGFDPEELEDKADHASAPGGDWGGPRGDQAQGCGCRSGSQPVGGMALGLMVLGLWIGRRRR